MSKAACLAALLYVGAGSLAANAMSVDEAYKAVPHARTVFDASASKLSSIQASALTQLFDCTDRGLVLRMEGLRALQDKNVAGIKAVLSGYRALTAALASLSLPNEIKPAHELVLQSIRLHQRYFTAKLQSAESSGKYDAAFTEEVYESSQKLQMAYGVLMQAFPSETASNKQAFYDYLCALDFR